MHCGNNNGSINSVYAGKKLYHSSAHVSVYEKLQYWDYSEEYGPKNWEYLWHTTTQQSPVDIVTENVKYDRSLEPFKFDTTPIKLSYLNNGVNALVTPKDKKQILITGGSLGNTYEFMQFHLHYGEVDSCGCEHTIDGRRYAAELHIVHYNCSLYTDKNEAFYGANGLAVLGVFLDASEEYCDNSNIDIILRAFDNILYEGKKYIPSDPYSMYNMLPDNTDDYFTYPGSLTTPPLTENVIWTLFKEPIKISKRQQKEFTKLYAVHYDDKDKVCLRDACVRSTDDIPQPPNICNNFRPLQPLHNRAIRSSFRI